MAMKLSAKDHIHNFELEHSTKQKKMKKVKIKARPETSHVVSSGSDQLLYRDMSSLFNEESNKVLFDKDIDYAKIPGINKITAAQMKSLKEKSKKNARKIESVLSLAKAVNSMGSGIGSGGYISRQLKAPGPHNGHNYVAPHERLIQADLKLPDNIDDYLPKPKQLVHDHPWDKNFVVARSISRDAYDEIKKITTFSALQIEVREMCGKTGLSTPKNTDTPTNKAQEVQVDVDITTKDEEETEFGDEYEDEFDDEGDVLNDSKKQPSTKPIAEEQWARAVQRVHFIGSTVLHIDLWEVSQYFEPPEIVVDVVGYLCILLGLKPAWDSAQGYLFKEISQVLKFLVHSEPFKIPKRRLRKAKQLKDDKFTTRLLMMLVDNKAMKKLVNWIFQFQKLADVILQVDERVKGRRAAHASSPQATNPKPPAPGDKDHTKKKVGGASPSKDKSAIKDSVKDLGEFFAEYQMLLESPEPLPAVAADESEENVSPAESRPTAYDQDIISQLEAEYFKDEPTNPNPEPFDDAETTRVVVQRATSREDVLAAFATTVAPPPNIPEPQSAPKKVTFKLSDKIEANYGGKGKWYSGTVTRVHASGRYDIKYDDGDCENAVEKKNVRECSEDGTIETIVHTTSDEKSKSGAPSSPRKEATADDEYADDKFDAAKEPAARAEKPPTPTAKKTSNTLVPSAAVPSERVVRFRVGDRVEGNYKGKGRWLPGKVTKVNNNGSYDVTYEDKHVDYMVKKTDVKQIAPSGALADSTRPQSRGRAAVETEPSVESSDGAIPAIVSDRRSASPSKSLRVGDCVEALGFKSKGKWLEGSIAKVNSNGSYDVNFEDGSVERMVKKANVRPRDVSAARAADARKETVTTLPDDKPHLARLESNLPTIKSLAALDKELEIQPEFQPSRRESKDLDAYEDDFTTEFEEEDNEEGRAKQKAVAEENAARQRAVAEEEAAKQRAVAEEEAAKQKADQEEAARQRAVAEEEAAKQRAVAEEEAAKQRAADEEAAQLKAAAEEEATKQVSADADYADDEFDVLDD